eukprot:scaffold421250_cov73-Attheya_sp.AAC.1
MEQKVMWAKGGLCGHWQWNGDRGSSSGSGKDWLVVVVAMGIVVLPREAGPMNSNNLGFRRGYYQLLLSTTGLKCDKTRRQLCQKQYTFVPTWQYV